MTKQQVEEKIKEILSKDKKYKGLKVSIVFKEKKQIIVTVSTIKKSPL